MICPKCEREQPDGLDECRWCGVIFSKIPMEEIVQVPTDEQAQFEKTSSNAVGQGLDRPAVTAGGLLQAFLVLMVVIGALGYVAFNGIGTAYVERKQTDFMHDVMNKVDQDAIQQYQIAERNGDSIDVCVQSGFVVAAFLQAHDETNYAKWKDIERIKCRAAGLNR